MILDLPGLDADGRFFELDAVRLRIYPNLLLPLIGVS
jgi:hypothetical protein